MGTPESTTPEEEKFLPLVPVPRKPRRARVRVALIGGGILFVGLGLASTLLVVAPGFLLWIPGLLLLGVAVPGVGHWINRQESKLPPKWRRRLRPRAWRKGRRKLQELR
jgi:hypothetical protein